MSADTSTPKSAGGRLWQGLRELLPNTSDYRGLGRSWRSDVVAGITVAIVALPLALGFGVSAGLSPQAGIITAIVAGFLAAVFGGSHVQVSGPTGAMVVVLAPIVVEFGATAVAVVSVIAGLIVIAFGLLRLGRTVSYIPWPVMEGFTLGIATIIFLQQVPLLTSTPKHDTSSHSTNAAVAAVQALASADVTYLLWSVATVAVVLICMLLVQRLRPSLPGSLLGIVAVTLLTWWLGTPLTTIGALPSHLPAPSLPPFNHEVLTQLLPAAVAVAVLAAIESLLSIRVAATIADTGRYQPDRELIGQGVASVGSGLFGGMPATGAIARTAVNVRAGGRTRLSAITASIVLALMVLVVAVPVGMIPLAGLAGVLMWTAWRMFDRHAAQAILSSTRADAAAFVITAVVTVSLDLIYAVLLGIAWAALTTLRNLARASAVTHDEVPSPRQPGDEHIGIIRIDGPLIFASADRIFAEVLQLRQVQVVIIRMSTLEHVDATGAHILVEIVTALERQGIAVLLKGIQPAHSDLFATVGVMDSLQHREHLFADMPAALAHARSHVARTLATTASTTGD